MGNCCEGTTTRPEGEVTGDDEPALEILGRVSHGQDDRLEHEYKEGAHVPNQFDSAYLAPLEKAEQIQEFPPLPESVANILAKVNSENLWRVQEPAKAQYPLVGNNPKFIRNNLTPSKVHT